MIPSLMMAMSNMEYFRSLDVGTEAQLVGSVFWHLK